MRASLASLASLPSLLHIVLSLAGPKGAEDAVWHFEGRFYGVAARAELDMRTRIARIALRGVPLGGRIEGSGSLTDPTAEAGVVVLDPAFEAALARRFVSIDRASLDRVQQTVSVRVRIPILGEVALVLPRVDSAA